MFADGEIEADFTSMGVKQVFRGPAERWVDTVRQTITGFDATQHFFANHSAEVDGARAVDTRYMQGAPPARHRALHHRRILHRPHGPDAAGVARRQVQADRHLQRRRPSADGHRVPQGDERRVTGAPSRDVRQGLAAGERVDLGRLQEAGDDLEAPWA